MKHKIFIGTDHAGFELKESIKKYLIDSGFEVKDMGAHSLNKDDDYPDFIVPLAKKVAADQNSRGIIFGSSGQGEAIAANRIKGARAAMYYGNNIDIIKLSRTHNNANILSLGAKFLAKEEAIEAVKLWLETDFGNEERHGRRNKKLDDI
ncbi:ribose-5-phosphate isomerase [Candidatus Woesearchaeota archaeon]|jgi:ribose 5-phosphate isomerase B|nr:ribose-5-phosphate isomerase [Candidatus Woesearchaeota archaeon]MDP6648009.1 RpiB/LacA/LacB family sugar-phosphate isomerase [Candidatus Woesearchaeota archaeon]|tara:strand:- start:49009 stop:49458 length:450 start_codon:yes stop_codon:yes gene_type:complete